jgi:lipocalin
VNSVFDTVLQLVTGFVPAGNTEATYALSTGWINDFYAGATPQTPQYGLYAGANQQIIFGNAAGVALPTPTLNQIGPVGSVLKSLSDVVFKLFGIPPTPEVNTGSNGVTGYTAPPKTNGVTGVKTGTSDLVIPSGNGYNAPSDWYFPTQADGSVQANGIIWLQHGFLGFKSWYGAMAAALAQETNSIVVVPQINWFDDAFSGEAAAEMFTGTRPALNISANQAGFQGTLPEKFILSGHSAGGRLATTIAGYTVDNGAAKDLLGVVMFDGVPSAEQLATSLGKLDPLGIPLYQIAAPPLFGGATEDLALLHPGQFIGVQIDGGTHTDSVSGSPIADFGSALVIGATPPGGKEAVRTFTTGWVNDFYAGLGATTPQPKYGIYGDPNNGVYQPNRPLVMGEASATTLPAPPPVDLNKYSGTWYEQGSVKQLFEIGLVNVKAVYTLQPDGSIKVQNSGNLFGPNGPQSGGTATAVPVNSPTNTRLNVGFFFGTPKATEPGNYTILDYDPNYSWVIVSDPNRLSGWILTRDQGFRLEHPDEYNALVERAKQLGVRLRITPSDQYPASTGV